LRPVEVLLAVSVPVIWATGFVLAKVALHDFPPILLMSLRFALTALVLVWFFRPPVPLLPKIFVISLISATIQYALTFNGLKLLDASTAGLLIQAEVPMCALLAALLLKERITLKMTFGMILAFIGVAIIAGEPRLDGNGFAILLVLGGGFFWSLGQVMTRQLGGINGFVLITWIAVFATPQMFLASWFIESNQMDAIRNAGAEVWIAVVYMGLIMTAIGYAIWYHLLGKFSVNKVAPFLLLLPVTILVESVLFLGEELTWITVVGGVLTICGVAVLVTSDPNSAST
jgi:O-acetylserine/cysteine efflux transporter